MDNTVKSMWESYRNDVVPDDAGEVQVSETGKAFYAGVLAMQQLMIEASDTDNERQAVANLERLDGEIEAYKEWLNQQAEQYEREHGDDR